MATAIPPLTDSEKLEFGPAAKTVQEKPGNIVIASYNIRYARGPRLISGGLIRKAGLMSLKDRPAFITKQISLAARAFSEGKLLPAPHVLLLQEADKRTPSSTPCQSHVVPPAAVLPRAARAGLA